MSMASQNEIPFLTHVTSRVVGTAQWFSWAGHPQAMTPGTRLLESYYFLSSGALESFTPRCKNGRRIGWGEGHKRQEPAWKYAHVSLPITWSHLNTRAAGMSCLAVCPKGQGDLVQ